MWQKRYQIICHFTITCSSALGEEVFNAVITAVLHWVQSAPWQSPRFCGFCCVQVVFEETDKHGQDRVILLPKDTRYLFHTLYVSGEEALLFHFGKPSHSAVSCSVQFFGFRRTAFDGFFSPFTDPWSGLAVSESVCFILEILPCMTPYSPAFFFAVSIIEFNSCSFCLNGQLSLLIYWFTMSAWVPAMRLANSRLPSSVFG